MNMKPVAYTDIFRVRCSGWKKVTLIWKKSSLTGICLFCTPNGREILFNCQIILA